MAIGFVGRTVSGLIAAACLLAPQAHAQGANAVEGVYCLVGVREVGSCMRLSPDGTFEYFLEYGAYNETSEGTWKAAAGGLVVDTPPYDRRATFSFKQLQKSESGAYKIMVVNKDDRGLAGIDVTVTCDGTAKAGYTQSYGFDVDCVKAPTAVALSVRMFAIAPQTIDVAGRAGADKAYVFEFDPGDLGKKRFAAHRLQVGADGSLTMAYTDTPIRELAGRPFRYEKQRQ